MREYFLKSERLGAGVWTDADLPLALGLWGDPDVTKLTGGPLTPVQVAERLAREMANHRQFGIQYWPIFRLETGEHVGCCGLRPYPSREGVCEFGFQLRKALWGQGFAREAARTVIAYAFTTLGLAGLRAGHHPKNAASRKILMALGFRYTHDEFYPPTQLLEPCYALRKDDACSARPA